MTSELSYRCDRCEMTLWLPLVRLTVSTLGLYDDDRFPGRCLLVVHEHHEDMTTMPDELASALLGDARRAALAITAAVSADRINYAVLGNGTPHVHYHVIPRKWDIDPAPGRSPWTSARPARPLPADVRRAVSATIISGLTTGPPDRSR